MLVVPLLAYIDAPAASSNERLNSLLAYLPGIDAPIVLLLLFLTIMLLAAALNYFQAVIAQTLEQQVLTEIRVDLYSKLMSADFTKLTPLHQSDHTRILAEETEAVTTSVDQLLGLSQQLIIIFVYTLLCFYLSPQLTVVAIALGLVLLLATLPIQRLIAGIGERHLDASESLYRGAADQIAGLRSIKSSGNLIHHIRQFRRASDQLAKTETRFTSISSLTQLIQSAVGAIAFTLIVFFALDTQQIDIPTLAVVALVFARLVPQVSRLHVVNQQLAFIQPSLDIVVNLKRELFEHQEAPQVTTTFKPGRGIELRDLAFQYPSSPRPILERYNLRLPGQGLVVLKGISGVGKSTLADLIAGITMPTSGSIHVGEQEVTAETLESWRQCVNYLPQTGFFVAGTIRENLNLLRSKPAPDSALNNALQTASAEFVSNLADGLASQLEHSAANLSLGEKQRLLIARALLSPRPVLILDEATANLDPDTEQSMAIALAERKTAQLIIVITHKQSFDAFADKIITMDIASGGT